MKMNIYWLPITYMSREDPLEKEMVIHSSILAWKIPWTEELGGATVQRVAELDTSVKLSEHIAYY